MTLEGFMIWFVFAASVGLMVTGSAGSRRAKSERMLLEGSEAFPAYSTSAEGGPRTILEVISSGTLGAWNSCLRLAVFCASNSCQA